MPEHWRCAEQASFTGGLEEPNQNRTGRGSVQHPEANTGMSSSALAHASVTEGMIWAIVS